MPPTHTPLSAAAMPSTSTRAMGVSSVSSSVEFPGGLGRRDAEGRDEGSRAGKVVPLLVAVGARSHELELIQLRARQSQVHQRLASRSFLRSCQAKNENPCR